MEMESFAFTIVVDPEVVLASHPETAFAAAVDVSAASGNAALPTAIDRASEERIDAAFDALDEQLDEAIRSVALDQSLSAAHSLSAMLAKPVAARAKAMKAGTAAFEEFISANEESPLAHNLLFARTSTVPSLSDNLDAVLFDLALEQQPGAALETLAARARRGRGR
jgi:hypothetical protein